MEYINNIQEIGEFENVRYGNKVIIFTAYNTKTKRDIIYYMLNKSRVDITSFNFTGRWKRL
jgi:predicted secreted protein